MTAKGEQLAVVVAQMEQNFSEHKEIKEALLRIENKLDKKTDNIEFLYWRNILVGGILLSIFLGIATKFVK